VVYKVLENWATPQAKKKTAKSKKKAKK